MGFIENLRRKQDQETNSRVLWEAKKIVRERERILQQRAKNRPQWEEAKRQFDESGLLTVLKRAIEFKTAKSYYVNPENFDDLLHWNFDVGDPYFYVELHIGATVKYHDRHYHVGGYSNKTTTKYVGILTDKDGTISFRGTRLSGHLGRVEGLVDGISVEVPIVIKVPKVKWERDRGNLENALGKAYHHPLISERSEVIDNPVFDRSFGSFKERFDIEHKERKI